MIELMQYYKPGDPEELIRVYAQWDSADEKILLKKLVAHKHKIIHEEEFSMLVCLGD